jgi:[ribosomal protein S5]-alanine N-acetyltransferase
MHPVKLVARHVLLCELVLDDIGALYKVYSDPEVTRHLSFEPRTMEQVESLVIAAIEAAELGERAVYMMAVADAASGELIGSARLELGSYDSAMIGFALRSDYWGRGLGVEVVRLIQRLGFDELGLHRIWGARSPINHASARTMQAVGMIEEGIIRGHLFTRGAWRDSVSHSILADEYHPTP